MSRLPLLVLRVAVVLALVAFAPDAYGWESCGTAVAAQGGGLGRGFNLSIYYMLATLALIVGGFAFLVRRAYRDARTRPFEPEGKRRWTDEPGA